MQYIVLWIACYELCSLNKLSCLHLSKTIHIQSIQSTSRVVLEEYLGAWKWVQISVLGISTFWVSQYKKFTAPFSRLCLFVLLYWSSSFEGQYPLITTNVFIGLERVLALIMWFSVRGLYLEKPFIEVLEFLFLSFSSSSSGLFNFNDQIVSAGKLKTAGSHLSPEVSSFGESKINDNWQKYQKLADSKWSPLAFLHTCWRH